MSKTTLTFLIMDGPFEQARTTTTFRMIQAALEKSYNVNVFAYEGAVSLSFAKQKAHANSIHGRSFDEEQHPLTKEWIKALQTFAQTKGCKLDWINCGLCVDERGVDESIEGCQRGTPKDFWEWAKQSNSLVIGTK